MEEQLTQFIAKLEQQQKEAQGLKADAKKNENNRPGVFHYYEGYCACIWPIINELRTITGLQ